MAGGHLRRPAPSPRSRLRQGGSPARLVGRTDGAGTEFPREEAARLPEPLVGRWKLQTDGGDFDQLSGASVTPRAVLKAIRETLVYFSTHREELFAMSSSEEQQ
jgi:hypothetical protein